MIKLVIIQLKEGQSFVRTACHLAKERFIFAEHVCVCVYIYIYSVFQEE